MKLFLDIDGVMVHANPSKRVELEKDGFYKFNSIAVEALNSIINSSEGGENELILSTSHRFRFSLLEWQNIFKTRGIFVNISILDSPLDHKSTRKTEIVSWINKRKLKYSEIIIIDDDKSLNELPQKLKKRLVLTNPYTGLDKSDDFKKFIKRNKKKSLERQE